MSELTNSQEDFSKYNGEGTILRQAQNRLLNMLIDFDRICQKYNIAYFISGGTCLGAVRHGGFIPWDDDIDIDVWHTDYQKLLKILPDELPEKYFLQTDKTDWSFARSYLRIVDKQSEVTYSDNRGRENFKHQGLWLDVLPLNKMVSYRAKKFVDYLYTGSLSNLRRPMDKPLKKLVSVFVYPVSAVVVHMLNFLSAVMWNQNKICHEFGTGMSPRLDKRLCFPPKKILFEGIEFYGPAEPDKYLEKLYGTDYMIIPEEKNRKFHASIISLSK